MDCIKYFTIDSSNYTRGNGYKIIGKHFNSHKSKNLFFTRVINIWNELPCNVIDCNSVDTFKRPIDKRLASNPGLTVLNNE